MLNALSFFYLLTVFVWFQRSRRAFQALLKNPEVKPTESLPSPLPLVSILLPVKNEEENLRDCLKCLLNQNYPAKEIIVINDNSIDRTSEILNEYARLYPDSIQTVNASQAPKGWTGKNWAIAQGTLLARGEWFLFTDADTRHDPWSLSSSVSYAESKDLDLLTLSPRCLTESFWEKTIQPAAMAFTGLWFPFYRVNDPTSRFTFGNGQYLMIRREAYQIIGGHTKVKGAFLEDFELVRETKKIRRRVECAIGTKIYGTRMYRSLKKIWRGWRRIFFHAFEKNPFHLLEKAISIFFFSFLPFLLLPSLTLDALKDPEHFGILGLINSLILGLVFLTAWKSHSILGGPKKYIFLHPLAALILTGILLDAAWNSLRRKELKWR
ncbi:MAG: glycosyltransferase [Candidatus Omnitrophica bacterium]|nr:glycosyltransferase [Candidatus Omnitrophota bacterium]